MEFKDETIADILESEKNMVLRSEELYGDFSDHVWNFNQLINDYIKSVDDIEKYIFIAFLSQIKKHLILAIFSALRKHHVQAGMNLRQVLEAAAWATYALGNKEQNLFCIKSELGVLDVPPKLKEGRDKWITDNFPQKSEELKRLKRIINNSIAHSNIIYAMGNFEMGQETEPGFKVFFFDKDDEFRTKTDLWFIANTAMGVLDLFVQANSKYKVFKLIDDFGARFKKLIDENYILKTQMMGNERFKNAQKTGGDKI